MRQNVESPMELCRTPHKPQDAVTVFAPKIAMSEFLRRILSPFDESHSLHPSSNSYNDGINACEIICHP